MKTTFIPILPGVYKFKLLVTDIGGLTSEGYFIVTVNKLILYDPIIELDKVLINLPENNSTTIDASKSYSQNGDISSYSWCNQDSPFITLVNSNTPLVTINTLPINSKSYTHNIKLDVIDNKGSKAFKEIPVTITRINNPPKIVLLSDNLTMNINEPITIDASKSIDPDNDTLSFKWKQTSGIIIPIDETSSIIGFTAPGVPIELMFELIISDGEYSSNAQVKVTIINKEKTPTDIQSFIKKTFCFIDSLI